MTSLIVAPPSALRSSLFDTAIVSKLREAGLADMVGSLDPRLSHLSVGDVYQILKERYHTMFIRHGLESRHFVLVGNQLKTTMRHSFPIVAGYIFEIYMADMVNTNSLFGYELFKWATGRRKLKMNFFQKYHALAIGSQTADENYQAFYNVHDRRNDIMFFCMNKDDKPEPALVYRSTIYAGVQVKAVTSNERAEIIEPLKRGQYGKVLTVLRHANGMHSYEACMREIARQKLNGEISEDQERQLLNSIGYPEMFGLEQYQVDEYYRYISMWHNQQADEDERIIAANAVLSAELSGHSNLIITNI